VRKSEFAVFGACPGRPLSTITVVHGWSKRVNAASGKSGILQSAMTTRSSKACRPVRETSARLVAWVGLGILVAWFLLQGLVRRPDQIVDDLGGWRGADTQTIARYFWRDGIDVLFPRIAWGGNGPGYVESELQLVPALIALVMHLVGYAEWPGQLLSMLSMVLAYLVLFGNLRRRFGPWPALFAVTLLLSAKGTVNISTSVQPDPLAFLFFVVAWDAFSRHVEAPSHRTLVVACAATTIAGLVKPTMLALGVAQFVLVWLSARALFKRPALWLTWATTVLVVGAYLYHARNLYLTYGNTFGILSGGDAKTPHLRHLIDPRLWQEALKNNVILGTGFPAVLAGLWLALRRRIHAIEWSLLAGNLAMIVVAFRYACNYYWGAHYHLVAIPLAAHVLAHAFDDLAQRFAPQRRGWAWIGGTVAVLSSLQYARAVYRIRTQPAEPEALLGRRLASTASPGDLIVVRARSFSYDEEWNTANNFQDPRLFYLSDTRGWVVANDQPESNSVQQYARLGAKYYVEPFDKWHSYPKVAEWLRSHARLAMDSHEGSIWKLQPHVDGGLVGRQGEAADEND